MVANSSCPSIEAVNKGNLKRKNLPHVFGEVTRSWRMVVMKPAEPSKPGRKQQPRKRPITFARIVFMAV